MKKDKVDLMELEGKTIIILGGSTGSGKSTLAHAFINGIKTIVEDTSTGRFDAKSSIKMDMNEREMFPIEHAVVSKTKTPEFYPLDKDLYLCEVAGSNSANIKHEFPN